MLPSVSSHPERYYDSGDLHFITATCYHRQPFLDTPARRDLCLLVLEHMRRRYRFAGGYMGNLTRRDRKTI